MEMKIPRSKEYLSKIEVASFYPLELRLNDKEYLCNWRLCTGKEIPQIRIFATRWHTGLTQGKGLSLSLSARDRLTQE